MDEFVVCMLNARKRGSDGLDYQGDGYLGNDLEFSTLDPVEAHRFSVHEADLFADHWRGWYRGFAGGVRIEVRPASERIAA